MLNKSEKQKDLNKYFPALLLLIVFLIFIAGPVTKELSVPDEPRVAEIAREMWQSGDYVVPRLNEIPFLEKPPLYYWSVASLYSIAGKANATISRIPSLFFGIGIILLTYALGALLFDRKTGFASALITLTTHQFLAAEYKCIIGTSIAFFVIASFYFFIRGYLNRGDKTLNYLLMYAMSAFAFLSKGPISLVIICPVILFYILFCRDFREIKKIKLLSGTLIFLLIVIPWFYLLWQKGGSSYFYFFFVENHWNRFFSASLGHKQSFFYYFPKVFEILFPWSICLPFVIFDAVKKVKNNKSRRETFFITIFAFIPFLLLSLPSTKRSLYLLPIVPAFSILTAKWMIENFSQTNPAPYLKIFEKISTIALIIISSIMTARWIWVSGYSAQVLLTSLILIISIISAVKFSFSFEYRKLFIPLFIISAITMTSYFNAKYETSGVKKSYYSVAQKINNSLTNNSILRGYDLSENDMSLPFYLENTFPEDKAWKTVINNLKSNAGVSYLINDDTLEDVSSLLPNWVDIKPVGAVDRSKYFLISHHNS